MMQNTAPLILCLLAGHVFLVSASSSYNLNKCEPLEFAACLKIYKEGIRKADQNLNLVDAYCSAFKELLKCFIADDKCVGELMDTARYMGLQHTLIDKKLGMCPDDDLAQPLRNHFNAKDRIKIQGLRDVDPDKFKPCAAKTNVYCVTQFAENVKNGGEICSSYDKFTACYESESVACDDQIYKDFVRDIRLGGEKLVNIAREFPKLFSC